MFSKILIANRGEVAVRVIRACKEMGIETVAIYSEADADGLHANLADESFCIGGARAKDSYLNMETILTLAEFVGAQAIHPGYGMLSENPEFARMCEKKHIALIGPAASVMEQMGLKEMARGIAVSAKVPVAPGSEILKDAEDALRQAEQIGYPVMLKARAGGGGKGIRIVREPDEMKRMFEQVQKEAENSFQDGAVFLEKYLEHAKHVEVQILADKQGNVVILGDRDCSVQRKNQKLIEECPAPDLSKEMRREMYAAAKSLAMAVHYTTVGTIEFLVRGDQFYFLEMNTRLQVEHSVTEMVCGIDIVKWQIRTAAGVSLTFQQEDIVCNRHAIECRICAENADTFTPATGKVKLLHIPGGVNVRFDTALYQGLEVTPFYDSMLGKLIVSSQSREGAVRKMKCALAEFVLVGVEHNRNVHMKFLENKEFLTGKYDTGICRKVL